MTMDTTLMIHVGAELVVIAGIVFYFKKETNALRAENQQLLQRVDQLEKVIAQHGQLLLYHESTLNPQQPQQRKPKKCPGGVCKLPQKRVTIQEPEEKEEEGEPDPAELDKELETELSQIKESEKNG